MESRFLIATILMGILLMSGCAPVIASSPSHRQIEVAVLHGGVQCGAMDKTPRAAWFDRPDQLNGSLLGRSVGASVDLPQWDPAVYGAVLISMGTRPTGGYGIELASSTAKVEDGIAVIQVHWRQPSPDMFVAQVITSPCLLLKLPKTGIHTIHIQDQEGRIQARVDVPQDS